MRSKIFQTMNLRESETIALKVSQKNHYRDGTFVFFPQEDIKVQIQLFFKMCKKGIWNREISIEHYKGTFKVEHFQMIETQFRVISPLRKISIINTQMDKEHMIVLKNLLQWLRPKKFEVELNNNELDDEDLQEFFFYVLESDLDLQKLFIISNPGIFKGRLLKEIKQKFPKRFSPIQVIFYRLILNKEYKSVALVQLQQKKDKQEIKNYIDEQQNILGKTCFYELNLSGCFTEQNYKGFINLINLSYDQDNLEQIQALDVSNNYLGDLNSFTTACSLISTAKGLLELKFRQVEQMKSSAAALALIGDRYDKLRINCFDISQNKFDSTKTLNILSNSIFLHCQEIHLKNIFQDEIFKYPAMQALNNAFLAMQKQFKEESVQSGYLKQYTLEELDLNVLESNQRSDLYQDLLNYLVFSEHSNIKKLSCLNLKDKVNLYVESALSFKDRIKAAKSHHFYLHQFRLPLKQVIIQLEENINIDLLFQLFQEFCFTQSQDPIQIKHVKIDGTNLDYYSRVNISDIFVNILNLNNQATYTLKSIELFDARTKMPIEIYQFLLLNEQIHLKGLTIIKDRFEENFSNYQQKTLKFLQTIPSKILSLQNLCLKDIKGEQLDICQLINLFFYNIQIRLKRLEIQNLQWSFNDTQKLNLQEQINNQSEGFEFSIKELTFGEFQDSSAEYYFYNYVLLTNFQKLKRLTLLKNSLEKNIQNIYLFLQIQFLCIIE